MQYFIALKLGEKRVKQSQDLLNLYTGNSAMPALALKDTKTNVWFPVGEENLIEGFRSWLSSEPKNRKDQKDQPRTWLVGVLFGIESLAIIGLIS